ncbi:hypothetical protein ACJMK2_037698 [Sinanodonta woodiana]|uniref:Uncharacterized protein n=1 Tax=Sinanodonta woodiana TaxID=1069815 RepID=A0ABD3WML8_SINWO
MHFSDLDTRGPAEIADFTNPDWAPTVKMGYDMHGLSTTLSSDRYKRKQMRQHMKSTAQAVQDTPEGNMVENPDLMRENIALPENEKCTVTKLSLHLLDIKDN